MKLLLVSDYNMPRGGNEIVTLTLREGCARDHDIRLFASCAYANGDNLADIHVLERHSPKDQKAAHCEKSPISLAQMWNFCDTSHARR